MLNRKSFLGWLGLFIFLFSSCQIGLGAAIDTKSPEINVKYPIADSIIRDAFYLSGSWADDGEIKGINLKVKRPDETGEVYSFVCDFKNDGTWSCVIDPLDKEHPIPDGTYEIVISITDTYEHVTTCSTLVTIDNTPPVVVLQRPSSKIGVPEADYDSYGQTFSLEGQAADDNNVALIQVDFYSDDACTNLIHTVTKTNVPSTILLDVASFKENVQNDYSKIYGSTTKEGPKNVYCTISAFDGSQRFPKDGSKQQEEDLKGNATQVYYLYDVVSSEILSKYKITEVYHMLNGSYLAEEADRTAENTQKVVDILSKNAVTRGAFILNPANNPYFTVTGRENLKKDGTDFTLPESFITNGSNIVVEVSPGLDGIPLDVDSIKVYFIECDDNAVIIPDAKKFYPLTSKTRSGNSYKFVTDVDGSCGIEVESKYIIGVEGTDIQKNPIFASGTGYGFLLSANGSAPILTITDPSVGKSSLKAGDGLPTSGTIYFVEDVPELEIKCNGTLLKSFKTLADYKVDPAVPNKYEFTYDIPSSAFSQTKSDYYEIEYTAFKENLKVSKIKEVEYDVLGPVISFDSISPVAKNFYKIYENPPADDVLLTEEDKNEYLNKEFEFKVSFTDDDKVDSDSTKYAIYAGKITTKQELSGLTPLTSGSINPTSKDVIKVDSSSWASGEITIVIEASDKVGNQSIYFENGYHVEQKTDKPVLIPSDTLDFSLETEAAIKTSGKNQFEKQNRFTIRCIDDDGIKSVDLYKGTAPDKLTKDSNGSKNYSTSNPTEQNFEYTITDEHGLYYYQIIVTDKLGVTRQTPVFAVKVKATASNPRITSVERKSSAKNTDEYIKTGEYFTNTITISGGVPQYKVYRTTKEDIDIDLIGKDETYAQSLITCSPQLLWELGLKPEGSFVDDSLKPGDTTTFYYIARDSSDNGGFVSNIYAVECKVDNSKPAISISSPKDGDKTGLNAIDDNMFLFNGTVSDTGSGANELLYAFTNTGSAPADDKDWKSESITNGIWSISKTILEGSTTDSLITTGNLYEGTWTLYVKAKDKVENVSNEASATFEINLAAPVLTLTNPDAEGKNATFELSGTAKDGNGLASIIVTTNLAPAYSQSVTLPASTDADGNWTVNIEVGTTGAGSNPLPNGVNILSITATDSLGKSSTLTKQVTVDLLPPEKLTITSPKDKTGLKAINENTFTFNGNAYDNVSGVAKVYYAFTRTGTAPDSSAYEFISAENGMWSFEKTIDSGATPSAAENLSEGNWYLWVKAQDSAGNTTATPVSVAFDVDLSEPEIVDTSTIEQYVNSDFILTGTAKDINGVQQIQISDGTFSQDIDLTKTSGAENSYNSATGEWSIKICVGTGTDKLADGSHNLKLFVKDNMGKSTYINRQVFVDTVKPVVDESKIKTPDSNDFDSASVEFKGTASDVAGSGVKSVQVLFADNENYSSGYNTGWLNASGDSSWSYVLNTADTSIASLFNAEGTKYVFVKATDNATNVSDEKHTSFLYDKAAPVLSDLAYNIGGSNISIEDGSSLVLGAGTFTLKGKFADSCSTVQISVTQNGTQVTPTYTPGLSGDWSIAVSNLTDGSYKYNVTAKDASGRSSESQTVTFRIDTTAPAVNTITAPSPVETESSEFTFKGTASDNAGGTGVEKVYVGFAERTMGATDWTGFKEAFGSTNWSCPINTNENLPDSQIWNTEGNKTVYVYAVDAVGNVSTAKTETFVYDKANPVVSGINRTFDGQAAEPVVKNEFEAGSLFTLSGLASDANGIASVCVTESKDGGAANNVVVSGTAAWQTEQLPLVANRENGKPKSGTYSYVIYALDSVNKKSAEITILVSVDVDAPEITITNPEVPGAAGSIPASADKSLSGTDVSFRGQISDSGTSGLKGYKYQLLESTKPAPSDKNAADWIFEEVTSNGSWSLFKNLGTGTTPSSPAQNTLYEGHYKLYVYAQDNAGNQSDIVSTEFFVDQSAPEISNVSYTIASNAPVAMTKGKIDYLNTTETSVTVSGKVTDSYELKELKINNETITVAPDSTWSKVVSFAADPEINLIITATDEAGRVITENYTLYCDKTPPTVEITSPDEDKSGNDSLSGSSYTFRFAVNDEGSGIKEYKYLFSDTAMTSAQIISEATSQNAQANGWITHNDGKETAKETFAFENGKTPATPLANTIYEGEHYIHMYGIDNSGNEATCTRTYWVDKSAPALTETNIPVSGVTLSAGKKLSLAGTVCDVNKITSLKVLDNLSGNEWNVVLTGDCDDTANPTAWNLEIELGSDSTKLADGEHTLTIVAKDGADKETQLSRTVIVDTLPPAATGITITTTPDFTDSSSNLWFGKSTVGIKVTGVRDTASADNKMTGIATVQYTTDTGANPSWIPLTKGTETAGVADWSASVYCPNQGINTIKIQIVDNAGNTKSDLSKTVYIDTERPELPLTAEYKVDDVEGVTGSKLINGRLDVKINVSIADGIKDGYDATSTSGLKNIVYKGVSDYTFTCTGAAPYEFIIPAEKLKTGQAKFVITDNVGNTQDWTPFSFILDNIPPTVKITVPEDADSIASGIQVNGTFTLEGSAKDTGGAELDSIDLWYYENSTDGWQSLENLSGESTWSYDIDSTLFTNNSTITVCVIVTDTAGNKNIETLTNVNPQDISLANKCQFVVDQDSDRPIIKFSTVDLNGDATGTIWLKNQTKIVGSVTDDDGIADGTLKIGIVEGGNTEPTWKNVTIDGTSWSFDLADFFTGTTEEKEKQANNSLTLYFKVEDLAGGKFISKAKDAVCKETDYSTVKLQSGTSTVLGLLNSDKSTLSTATILPVTVDTLPPTVEILGGKIKSENEYTAMVSSLKFGGSTNKSFYIKTKAGDGNNSLKTNGVSGTATFKDGTTNLVTVQAAVTGPENTDEYVLTFTLTDAQIAGLKNISYQDMAEIKVVAEDLAGNKSTQTTNITADYKNPEITFTSPDRTQYLSGSITAYGSIDSTATMYYSLSLDDTTKPGEDSEHPGNKISSWKKEDGTNGSGGSVSLYPYYKQIYGNSFQWFLYFDNGTTTETATHDDSLRNYLIKYGITTEAALTANGNGKFTDIVQMFLWVKAIDESGNMTETVFPILVDPQGDAPKISIDYPETDGVLLGGAVTIRGTATDTIGTQLGIDSVWIQILKDSDGSSFAPTVADVNLWINNYYDVYQNMAGEKVTSPISSNPENYYIKTKFAGSSWSIKINNGGEFDPTTGKTNIAYKVWAKDKDGNLSKPKQMYSKIDADNPVISELYLRQYENNDAGTGNVVASKAYEDEIWVKDTWWLCGKVSDVQGLSSLTVNNSANLLSTYGVTEQEFKYQLETYIAGNAGLVEVHIVATDTVDPNAHITTKDCTVRYDNKTPEVIDSGKLYEEIVNSNGFYSFNAQVTEATIGAQSQSGFDYLAFWFEKSGKFIDVMREKSLNQVDLSSGLQSDSGLKWKQINVSSVDAVSGEIKLSSADSFIHVGGLCKVDGTIYKITEISPDGMSVFINGQFENKTYSTALFALANVIDNTVESGSGTKSNADGKYGYFENITNDDGDHIVESVQKSGTTWSWEANINSQNIPDGPVTLHYVAFDKAGNYTEKTFAGFVKNNAPRLAGLRIWNDYDGNGEDNNESEYFYYASRERKIGSKNVKRATDVTSELIVSGNDLDYTDENARAFMNVTEAPKFYPEIVGGNGALYYDYKIGTGTDKSNWNKTGNSGSVSFGTATVENDNYLVQDENQENYVQGYSPDDDHPIAVSSTDWNSLNNGLTWFEYTIWDSTDGTTQGYLNDGKPDSLSAKFRVALNVKRIDEAAPNAAISPLYWQGTGYRTENGKQVPNNSIYGADKANGHIELPGDLSPTVSDLYGDDPKVSGKITFRGTAYDDIRLKTIYMKFDGLNTLVNDREGYLKALTYDNASGTWIAATSTPLDIENDGFEISAENEYCDKNGHQVNWEISIDTSKIENTAGLNKKLYVQFEDERTSNLSAEQTYQMDIVPYITAIETTNYAKSGLKKNNIRSASGKYSVIEGSTGNFITVKGFNLNPSNARIVDSNTVDTTTVGTTTGKGLSIDFIETDYSSIELANMATKSGYLELFVNGIRTLNNINDNDAYGSYTFQNGIYAEIKDYEFMPNREADYVETKNVQLTDDRYIRFFKMHQTDIKNGYYPTMLAVNDPDNNPATDDDGVVFSYLNLNGGPSDSTGNAGSFAPEMAMPQRAVINSDGTTADTEYLIKGSVWDQMAMARDEGGRYYNYSVFNRSGSSAVLIYDRYNEIELMRGEHAGEPGGGWGAGNHYGSGDYWVKAGDFENNAINLDHLEYNGLMVGRYQYPKLIVKGDSTSDTENASVYLSVYDEKEEEIIVRDFMIGKNIEKEVYDAYVTYSFKYYSKNPWSGKYIYSISPTGTDLTGKYIKINNEYKVIKKETGEYYSIDNNSFMENTTVESYIYEKNGDTYTVLFPNENPTKNNELGIGKESSTGDTYAQRISFKENSGNNKNYNTGRHGIPKGSGSQSKHFAMGVTSDNKVIIAYYDMTTNKLVVKYSKSGEPVTGEDPNKAITWSTPNIKSPDYVGQYVSMAIDSNDHIHIAAYDEANSDLKYIFMNNYKAEAKTVTVDQYASVGNWTQIKVNSEGIPYIAYVNATENGQRDAIKLAYLTSTPNSLFVPDGIDEDGYTTGEWEYMTVPAITPPQSGDPKFQSVSLDFDSKGRPVVGYLGTNLEFGKWLDE